MSVLQGFPSLTVILEIHSTSVLDSGDAAFPQLAASPHSMDSVLQAGEGNYSVTGKVVAVTPTCTDLLLSCTENLLVV